MLKLHKQLHNYNKQFFFLMKYLYLFIFLFTSVVFSQTQVEGVILDEYKEPIPFANIMFKGSTTGTSSDENGFFFLESEKKYKKIKVTFLGFKKKIVKLPSNIVTNLKIILIEEAASLEEVVIVTKPKKRLKKKENPAYKILQGIWKNKRKNGLNTTKQYKYQQYQATEFGMNNIDTVFMKRIFKSNYDSIAKRVENFKRGKKFYVPLFLTEVMSEIYGDNLLNKKRALIKGTKSTGVNQQGFFTERLKSTFQNVDISKNTIVIFEKPFVNPLATTGFGTYDYLLKDSTIVNNEKQYKVYFFPREDGDLAFNGHFIVGKNYAIKKIILFVNKKANLNMIRSLSIEKSFSMINDSIYVPQEDYFEADLTAFTKGDGERGVSIKETRIYKDYEFNNVKPSAFYDETVVMYNPQEFEKGEKYWSKIRLEGTKQNANSSLIITKVKNAKSVKRITDLAQVFLSGYLPVGNSIEFGNIYRTIGNNNIEGISIRAGLRTFKSPHDRFKAGAHVSYGTKDKAFKYGGNIGYVLAYKPRLTIDAGFSEGIEQLGSQVLDPKGLFAGSFGSQTLISRGDNYFLSKINRYKTSFSYEPAKNFQIQLSGEFSNIISASPEHFSIDYIDTSNTLQSEIKDASLHVNLMYTPKRNVYGYGIRRVMGANLFPTFIASYKKGVQGIFNSNADYHKLQLYYNQPIVVSNFGILNATLEYGKTFGEVPLSLLSVIPGNQSLTISNKTFSLMNYYEFVTDTYATGFLTHRFNGLIMNRIPLIKKLKLRSLLIFRGAWGSISDKNNATNRSTSITHYIAPTNKIYYEYGFGIENIGIGNLKVFRVDFIWRGSYLDNPGFDVPNFGIRMGINPKI